ncbi:MAG TPA: hypothetical protein VM841_14405 [Actinomycetota bacterium]|nr:hypothetical protein [Actinomycetota bacterium]
MYARINTFEGAPEGIDASVEHVRTMVLPVARGIDGFAGLLALGDRTTGKTIGITFWRSLEAMHASEQAADRLRDEVAAASNERVVSIEQYEVLLDEKGP